MENYWLGNCRIIDSRCVKIIFIKFLIFKFLFLLNSDIVDAVGLAWDLYSAYNKANAIISCV